jgi:hypothetical protein
MNFLRIPTNGKLDVFINFELVKRISFNRDIKQYRFTYTDGTFDETKMLSEKEFEDFDEELRLNVNIGLTSEEDE